MPPRQFSRHSFTIGQPDSGEIRSQEVTFLSDRVPFVYRERPDNIIHQVLQGETLFTLAGRYYRQLPRASGLWWVIADFQPKPVHDPTIELAPGTLLVIPSLRTIIEEVFNEERRDEREL